MLRLIDTNRDGVIDYSEFEKFYQSATLELEKEQERAKKAVEQWHRKGSGDRAIEGGRQGQGPIASPPSNSRSSNSRSSIVPKRAMHVIV
jgi:hypothetical protein